MYWLAGLLLVVIAFASVVIGRERAARRRRNRLIRSSIEPSYKVTRSQRSEMRGDSHHDGVAGRMSSKTGESKTAASKPSRPVTTRRRG